MLASSVPEMYLVFTGLGRGWTGGLSPMSTSPLDPQEIRAAAEAHKELGPEYSDAVIESFLERVDRESPHVSTHASDLCPASSLYSQHRRIAAARC
jgi:hypothetical protein